jgi:pimeloyl-ACP methyl ester carboxylesterase
MRPTLLLVLLCTLLAAGTLTARAEARPPVPDLQWRACDGGFECATAEVPLDHRRPRGRQIELALLRIPATDREQRIGSVFVQPGGPGLSGVQFVRDATAAGATAALSRRFDVIGLDTRGSGGSRPAVDCDVDPEQAGLYAQPFVRPDTLDVHALVERTQRYVARCVQRNGELLQHMSAADMARDLDLLRAAVGDERLNYIGASYGTLLGATYASLFPGRPRAMVLADPVDADTLVNRPLEALREQSASFEDVLDRFFAACAAHQTACGFGGADPEDAYELLLERVDAAPLPAGPGAPPLDGDDARVAALRAMGSPHDWPELAAALAAAEAGDGTGLRRLADDWYSDPIDAYWATLSVDQAYPHRVAPFLEAGRHAFSMFPSAFLNSGYSELPLGLSPVRGRPFRGPFTNAPSAGTALVIGMTHDPNTPYAWAKRLTRDLGNARLLTLRGDGHDILSSQNPCILGQGLAYLEEGTLPPPGASCRREPPF